MSLRLCRTIAVLFAILSLTAEALAQDAGDPQELRIVRITPEGEDVGATRQIVLQFNRPIVPVGEMARTAAQVGVTITPAVNCEWRWLNTSALSCNLSEKDSLQPSTAYKLHVEPIIEAEDGAHIAEYDHSFITQRARVEDTTIRTWTAPDSPSIYLSFNQPVTQSSAQGHIYFEHLYEKTRYPVLVTKNEDDEAEAVKVSGEEARSYWVVKPKEGLPLNSAITLKYEAGLISAQGAEPSKADGDLKQFYTYPPLSLRGVVCRSKDNEEVIIAPGSPQTDDQLCNPLLPISLAFTSPVLRSQLKDNLAFTPSLTTDKKVNPWGDQQDWSRLTDERTEQAADYRITLPYGLKAAQQYSLSIPAKLNLWNRVVAFFKGETLEPVSSMTDEFGRPVPAFKIDFATGHRNPNFEMVYNDAVLEKGLDTDVPLYVNNLKNFSLDYQLLTMGRRSVGTTKEELPVVEDKQFAVPAGIRSIMKNKTGAVYAQLTTDPIVNKWENAGRLFAQVTPYQVYAKLGHFRSTVWVSDLATGAVVSNARVTVYKGQMSNLQQPSDIAATVTTDENGVASFAGLSDLDPDLSMNRSYKDSDTRLFVRVDKGGDMALLPLTYDYEVRLWNIATDIYNDTAEQFGHMKAWGMTAQGIYRAGDTMQYKIYVRDQNNNRFIAPPAGQYTIDISDPTGKSIERRENVTVSAFGTLDGTYKIPQTAPVGWYQFKLEAKLDQSGKAITKEFYPLSVLVSDFTPAPFHVTTELNGDSFKAGDKLDITADAKLHSGGPFGGTALRSTITLRARYFSSKDPNAQGYSFNSFEEETDREDLLQKEDKLNDKGEWTTSFTLPEKKIAYGQLVVESAVRDDRGKSIAGEARADYAGVDRLVGLKPNDWVFESKKPATVKAIVVDTKGVPTPDTKIHLTVEKEEVVTAKVKSAGNAYLSDNTVDWKKTAQCDVTSAVEGQDCTFTPESAGTYRITAAIKDTKGREHQSRQTLWVSGADYVQWNEGRENALTILPERTDYKVGDTARYLVKNPFPGVTALVTVERLGVLDHFVQKLEGSTPVIEVPIKPDYTPGFYLSVVVLSPRVDTPPPEMGQIDLGKPSFRVGYVKTPVTDPYKTMTVTAKAEQEVYRPRDIVKVLLEAKPLHEQKTKEPVEIAIAVLDESVFDLISAGKDAFDPYHGFYDLENLDVVNYSLLTRLIGRQKFEKKGANPGGDGGIDAGMRNLFKFVSYWNPSVPVDENGLANIEFEAPDNLTGWRVLALAVTKNDLMGLGETNFKVNRPTEIRPVMPNQVREGDKFDAGFSVMNRTDQPRTIKVKITAIGDIKAEPATKEETLTLEPYKRATVLMPIQTALLDINRELTEGQISFSVTAGDDVDTDGLEHDMPVLKARTIETAATYGSTMEKTASENIAVPAEIFTDVGDIGVSLSPSIIGGLDGAFKYIRDYPYPCWEQKLTTAVMASHYQSLRPYLGDDTVWPGADTLPQIIIDTASSYQAPNGGMAYYVGKDEYADPYLSAYTALAFGWLKKSGHAVPAQVEEKLQTYLLDFLRNKTAPDHYQDGMTSTVRAVILAALKDSGAIQKDDVLRFRDDVKGMSLFGKAQYLQAASTFPETKDAARETLGMILSSGVESGGKFSFNDTYNDGYARILATPLRDNCAVLDSFLEYGDPKLIGDTPSKLVRMITQSRGNRDHWENTQENIFCMNALVDYAAKYESVKPNIKVTALYQDKELGVTEFHALNDKHVTLARPIEKTDDGTKGSLTVIREGKGRLYYEARLRYAPKTLPDSVNAGIDIRREYSVQQDKKWVLASSPLTLKRGDLVKVDLYLSIPTARNFVAVNDPLPGGLETVNRDLATTSNVDADQAQFDESGGSYWFKFNDWTEFNASRWSFYHKELRNDSARFYADWLTPGNYHLSYMAQAIATGTFAAPPVKAEEMYDPDIYGLGTKGELVVNETP